MYRDDAPVGYLSDAAMKPDDYQKRFDTLTKEGYIPTCVQSSGADNALITPIWTRSGSTGDRVWHAPSGPAPAVSLYLPFVPLVYGGADYSTYDAYGGWCMASVDFAAFLAAMNRNPCAYFKSQTTFGLLSKQNKAYSTTLAGQQLEDPSWTRGWSLGSFGAVNLRWSGGTLSDIGCYFSLDDNGVAIVAFLNTGMNTIDASYWNGLQGSRRRCHRGARTTSSLSTTWQSHRTRRRPTHSVWL